MRANLGSEPFLQDAIDWRLEVAEVFARGGLDIAIANPPNVRMEQFGPRNRS